ncbi:MAG: penicillin-binding protein [Tissierellia bacterium]|nr:penicillin-binding protein [Tissierellia bacterium]
MKLLDKIKNRYNILIMIMALMLLALSFKLATLTIVEGDRYRDMADNKRLKEVYITAPRGEIRDRNGRLLAGNKPSFTVQLLKDELDLGNKEDTNEVLLTLTRLLEEDGVNYVDEFPLEFNIFKFSSEEVYNRENTSPTDKVMDIIVENNLLGELLDTYYIDPNNREHYQFLTANRAINALEAKGVDIPIETKLEEQAVIMSFKEFQNIDIWKENYNINREASPKEALIQLINNDKNIIRKLIDHPISRQIVFNMLASKGLNEELILEEYSLKYDEDFLEQKRSLMKDFPNIDFETNPKDDFVNIVTKSSLESLLGKVTDAKDEKGNDIKIVPGKILIDMIEKKGLESPVNIDVHEENNSVLYSHKNKELSAGERPIDTLINFAKEENLLGDFITDDSIKGIAQEALLNNGVNPKISISTWEYVSVVNKQNWYDFFKIKEDLMGEELFDFLKGHFKIKKHISKYEARTIMTLYDQLYKQGQRAYQPINIAYGIKDSTVAKIEEGLMDVPGIQVSVEPIRYYPEGEIASHLLGYLGKISQTSEIEKYVKERDYSPNDIIGKTGIEEKFELELKGKPGIKRVEVDVYGNTTNVLTEENPKPGNNIYLTIDTELQKVARESLKHALEEIQKGGSFKSKWGDYKYGINKSKGRPYIYATSGAVVAIDVKTGELLAMENYPSYDPNLFSTGISNSDWLSLFPENEEDLLAPRPLYNIAIQTAVQPGSTFKMVTALAALEKGFPPTKTIRDMGYVDIGTSRIGCWIWNTYRGTHGRVNVYDALRDSCNYYFYSLAFGKNPRTGESLGMRVDIEDIANISKQLGLNDKTGIEINIPREESGGVPDPQRKVVISKGMLRRYLNNNIHSYIKEDVKLDEDEIKEIIEEIVSWIGEPEPMSRGEVIKKLDEMGFYPEKVLPNEKSGLADKIKFDYINQASWNITDTLNITIGQGQNSYTAIQMANYVATLSNGGYRHKVTAIDNIKSFDNSETLVEREVNPERIELNDYENLEHVKLGMKKVTTEGTSKSIFGNFPVTVATKTGTAQNHAINPITGDYYDDYAWFVAFAPYEDPEIAVAVVLFQGGSGGYAGPIVREVIAEYLGLNSMDEKEVLPFEIELAR